MMSAMVASASVSALKVAPIVEELFGMPRADFVQMVKSELHDQGVPGANGMFALQFNPVVGSAPIFTGIQNSGFDGPTVA